MTPPSTERLTITDIAWESRQGENRMDRLDRRDEGWLTGRPIRCAGRRSWSGRTIPTFRTNGPRSLE
jgi:hypothetical protein